MNNQALYDLIIADIDNISKRFWSKVDIKDNDDCWNWNGALDGCGYGSFGIPNNGMIGTHRIVWMLERGAIPENMCILHRCDNPQCVNPNHLFIGTRADNMRDMVLKGRMKDTNGLNNGNRKLDEVSVIAIRLLHQLGYNGVELGQIYGVSKSTIGRICRRIIWKHI